MKTVLFFLKILILCIYFWLCWVFIAAMGFSLVAASWGYSLVVGSGLLTGVASLVTDHGLSGVQAWAVVVHGLSSCSSWAPEHRLNGCGTWAWLLHSMRDLSGSGIKPVSPSLANGFFTTEPLGMPKTAFFWLKQWLCQDKTKPHSIKWRKTA